MSSKGQSDAEPEIDPNFDYKINYGRRNPKDEIKEFRNEQKEKEKEHKSKNKENFNFNSPSPPSQRGSSLEVSTKNSEGGFPNDEEKKNDFDIDATEQKIIRKKVGQKVDDIMSQFPQSDHSSKDLYNLIYNVIDEDKGLKNEFIRKEISEKKRQMQEQKVMSQMIQDRLVQGKAAMDVKVGRTPPIPIPREPSRSMPLSIPKEYKEQIKEKQRPWTEKEMERYMYGHPTINGKINVYGGRKVRKKKEEIVEEDGYDLRGTQLLLSNILQKQMEKNRKKMEKINLLKEYTFDEDKKKPSIFSPESESKFREKAIEYSRMLEIKRIEAKKNEKMLKSENKINYNNYTNKINRYYEPRKWVEPYENKKTDNNLGEIIDKIDKLDDGINKKIIEEKKIEEKNVNDTIKTENNNIVNNLIKDIKDNLKDNEAEDIITTHVNPPKKTNEILPEIKNQVIKEEKKEIKNEVKIPEKIIEKKENKIEIKKEEKKLEQKEVKMVEEKEETKEINKNIINNTMNTINTNKDKVINYKEKSPTINSSLSNHQPKKESEIKETDTINTNSTNAETVKRDSMDLEKEAEKDFTEKDYAAMIDSQKLGEEDYTGTNTSNNNTQDHDSENQLMKKKRGRPYYEFTTTLTESISEKILQKKNNPPPFPSYTSFLFNNSRKKRRRGFFDYLIQRSYYSNIDGESNDINFLEILFREYGYNNIVYILTDSPEIKLGETKIKKIKGGLENLLGYEENLARIIETIINMRKSHLVDESWIKGKYNYRTRNKNNINITSFHYRLHKDGFIYKYRVERILQDGSIMFICCDCHCQAKGILFPRIRKFVVIEKHSLLGMQHDYLQEGYDKYQYKMEYKRWKEIQLKDNQDEKKSYIDWHKAICGDNI